MKNQMRSLLIGGILVAGLAVAGGLKAFNNVGMFGDDPSQGAKCGGGGIFGTGSTTDWGITCAHCHINDVNQQGNITASISYAPALSGGKYVPGTQYTVTLKMIGEHLGLNNAASNTNGFVVTYEDAAGKKAGSLLGDMQTSCPSAVPTVPDALLMGQTYAFGDCHAVASLARNNVTPTWSFKWTAPSAGTGPVTLFYGVVDGDSDKRSIGDDVKMGKAMLAEGP